MISSPSKRLGILTSGGDCPGLNAVIRAVVNHASVTYGWEVIGIPYATQGLQERQSIALSRFGMDLRGFDPLLQMGGTILGSLNKGDTLEQADAVLAGYQELGLDALIGIGGDGSLGILNRLAEMGNWQFVGVPKTIDRDVALTEQVVGFDTALNTVTDALNRLVFTACSHDRVMIVEVMGRDSGNLALHAGIAGGADVILIPEIPYTVQGICDHLSDLRSRWGRKYGIVVVAEGATCAADCTPTCAMERNSCGMGQYMANEIHHHSNGEIDTRVSILGHIQRGGIPTAQDRLLATCFGKTAVDLIAQGATGQMVAVQMGQMVAVPLADVVAQSPTNVAADDPLIDTARGLGIYLGQTGAVERAKPIARPLTLACLLN
jgi:ATP-dependent phosphofructokinase / diphosphate-dependent phosphofructokinase